MSVTRRLSQLFHTPLKASAALALVVVAGMAVPAASEAAAPAWSVQLAALPAWTVPQAPSNGTVERLPFEQTYGGYGREGLYNYTVTVQNSGDAPTVGTYVLADTLPQMRVESIEAGPGWSCPTTAQVIAGTPLTCSRGAVLAPGESTLALSVRLYALPSTPDPVANEATISGGGAASAATASNPLPVVDRAPFAVKSFTSATTDNAEADYALAGGHPDKTAQRFEFPTKPELINGGTIAVEVLKDAGVTLPTGFIGNPAAAARCAAGNITASATGSNCPPGSQVGFAMVALANGSEQPYPIFNVKPDRGYPAQFAFRVTPNLVTLYATQAPRSEDYDLTIGSKDTTRVSPWSFSSVFWGVPAQHGSGIAEVPFLSNPVDCSDADPTWSMAADSWEHVGAKLSDARPNLADPNWKTASAPATPVSGCEDPKLAEQFDPRLKVNPLQGAGGPQADQPTGLSVAFEFPQSNDPTDLNTTFDPSIPQAPAPKDVTVTLPPGLAISPSSADGLAGCSDRAADPAGDQVRYDDVNPVSCPEASKIGSLSTTTPLIALRDPVTDAVVGPEPVTGDVYLVKPHPGDLGFGTNQDGKFRLLMEIRSPRYGIDIKLPGIATADKQTGQLRATFADNPQLPASTLQVNLKSGPRAPLASPVTCGKFTADSDVVPWSFPGTPVAHPSASFNIGSGPNGSGCANTPGARPFAPAMSAGTESSKAGASSPFVLKLTRNDGEQEFSSLEATLPKGLAAKFAGVPYCSDSALSAAAGRAGSAELSSPTCPASRIGKVTVGAGPGSNPFYTDGNAYLAGPYKGAPMSVAVITPAVAGPFDLGTVVVRNALYVNPETAQGRVVSDPFPTIIDGVPLRLRSITVRLDRPSFMLNPTNCSPLNIEAKLTSSNGASSSPTNRFQASACDKLGFKPDLKLSLKGGTKRADYPAFKATLTYPRGDYANIAKAVVSLPHSEFLAQNHIKTVCTRVQYAADQCPAGSIYGSVVANTPLLEKPLEGPLYLRSSSNPLPDLVAALHGQIDVDLVGRIDSKNGGIRTTFDAVPDAPVTSFTLTMLGGKKGLLENSKNLCNSVNRADVSFVAQNGMEAKSRPVLTNSCKKKGKKGKGAKKGAKGKGAKRLARLGF